MAESVNQTLTDDLLLHDIDVLRVLEGEESAVAQGIDALTKALIVLLITTDPTEPIRGAFRQRRLSAVIQDASKIIREHYREMYRSTRRNLLDLASEEAQSFQGIVNQALQVRLLTRDVDPSVFRHIIDERTIQANVNDADSLRGFFEREAAAHHRRVAGTLRQGFASGESLTQLTARLRAVTAIQETEAVGIARTAYNHVTNQLRIEMMQRNSFLFRGVIAIAVLDGRTTQICISRSNGMWDLNTGRPLPESPVQIRFPGSPPWHFKERTQLYPVTKTAAQIGRGSDRARRALAELTPEQRTFLNADPPRQESYPDWLRRQPESVQLGVLGKTRRELWLQGKLSLRDLVSQKGRTLTLAQLARKREPT